VDTWLGKGRKATHLHWKVSPTVVHAELALHKIRQDHAGAAVGAEHLQMSSGGCILIINKRLLVQSTCK
jgi:hypothetical protein